MLAGINLSQRAKNQLDKLIDNALGIDEADGTCKSTVVSLHLSQMSEWGVRGGAIQWKAVQDFNGIRKEFIAKLISDNNWKNKAEPCMARMVAKGEVLLVALPSKNGYKLDYFTGGKNNINPDYHIFYKENEYGENEIDAVVIKQATELTREDGFIGNAYDVTGSLMKKWRIIFLTADKIYIFKFLQEPVDLRGTYSLLESFTSGGYAPFSMQKPIIIDNPFAPELPCVVCKNIDIGDDKPGLDDFYKIRDMIETHNSLLIDAVENLQVFYTPTMITSRPADAVLEDFENYNDRKQASWASNNGFFSPIARRSSIPYRMPRVIGNAKPDERMGYIEQPDTISGDHNLFIRNDRELIHWVLGGVDPLGISASATFGEIKSLFGRIENTASKKAETLFGQNGLCKLLSLIILAEERKCKLAIGEFIINQYLQGSPIANALIQQELSDEQFRALYLNITDELNAQLPGLPPLGARDCSWRYTKDVFQRTTREQQEASIVFRNEREDGISQEIALGKLYPNMSDEEIRQSMSGFSPRVVSNALNGISGALALYMQLAQLPSPNNPEISWASELGLAEIVRQGIITLQKEMNYNIPDFKESPDYDEINATINSTLQQLNNVRDSVPTSTVPLPSATAAARRRARSNR
jgi:hypothetical protein